MKKILVLFTLIAIGLISYYFYNQNNTQVSTELYEYVKIEKGSIKKVVSIKNKENLLIKSKFENYRIEFEINKKQIDEEIIKKSELIIYTFY